MQFIAIAIIAILAIGGGTAVVANQSVPGDALYEIKTEVNEKVEVALSFSDESRAEEHLEAIEERHSEGAKLEAEGKLNAQAKANLNANIGAHARAFATALANVKASGNTEASTQLEAKLQTALKNAEQTSSYVSVNADANIQADAAAAAQNAATGSSTPATSSGQGGATINSNGGVQVGL